MKRGDLIEVEVAALTTKGDGMAYVGHREVVVRQSIPGDRVSARVVKKRKGRIEAEVEEFLAEGYKREESRCAHFWTLRRLSLAGIALCGPTRRQGADGRQRIGNQWPDAAARSADFAQSDPLFLSQQDGIFLWHESRGLVAIGLARARAFQLDLRCRRVPSTVAHFQSHRRSDRRISQALGLSAYDLKRHQGLLRFLVVREGKRSGEVMVNLVVASYPDPGVQQLAEQLLDAVPEIDVLLVTLHTGKAQVAAGEREFVLKGSGRITEVCASLEFDISPQSFFQTNSLQAERLYAVIARVAGPQKAVLDLYCGTGSISLLLARQSQFVLGIEVVAEAVEDARRNAARNRIEHCEFTVGAAEDILGELAVQGPAF